MAKEKLVDREHQSPAYYKYKIVKWIGSYVFFLSSNFTPTKNVLYIVIKFDVVRSTAYNY